MRQEHLFPNALSLAIGYHGYRTITGLSLRDRCIWGEGGVLELARYLLYISYNDGVVIGYELKLNSDDRILVGHL